MAIGEKRTSGIPPSGICHSFTRQSSAPVARRESLKGEKSKSVTNPEEREREREGVGMGEKGGRKGYTTHTL